MGHNELDYKTTYMINFDYERLVLNVLIVYIPKMAIFPYFLI